MPNSKYIRRKELDAPPVQVRKRIGLKTQLTRETYLALGGKTNPELSKTLSRRGTVLYWRIHYGTEPLPETNRVVALNHAEYINMRLGHLQAAANLLGSTEMQNLLLELRNSAGNIIKELNNGNPP